MIWSTACPAWNTAWSTMNKLSQPIWVATARCVCRGSVLGFSIISNPSKAVRYSNITNPRHKKRAVATFSYSLLAVFLLVAGPLLLAHDVSTNSQPSILKEVGFEPTLNAAIPPDLQFLDETGRSVRLRDYFGKKPLVLALVYYTCPMLCNQALEGIAAALRVLKLDAGKDFDVVAVSINPQETPAAAMTKKEDSVARYHHTNTEAGWHFLTGQQSSIAALASAVGFRYLYDAKTKTFVHASGILVLTPEGRISRYIYGIEYAPRDLRLALVEASAGKIGTAVDHVLLFCYEYDPATGRYGGAIMRVLRLTGVLIVVALVASILIFLRRERRALRHIATGGDVTW
jgi:protein SCO1/2